MSSDVPNFYNGQNVLITGGTGYLGKLIIGKLLRTTNVNNIYVIIRHKKGISSDQRLQQLFDDMIFTNISKDLITQKLHAIEGDLSKTELGLSEADKSFVRDKVNIVFHCAASLNMKANLVDAVMTNVNGTAALLDVIKEAKHLKAVVVVSTAYSYCINKTIEEKFYETPINADVLLNMAEHLKPELFELIGSKLSEKWPNTYTFTKAVAESLLKTRGRGLPIALFRPSIVTSTVSDPVAGWSDNLYGPLGVLLSTGCGILRVFPGDNSVHMDTVPGDFAVNAMLCLAWNIHKNWESNPNTFEQSVYNFSGYNSPLYLTTQDYSKTALNSGYPRFKRALFAPMLIIIYNKFIYNILTFILHTIPGMILDIISVFMRKKPRMYKIYSKMYKVTSVLLYFVSHEWKIKNDNVAALWKKLSPSDQTLYNFDLQSIDRDEYFYNIMTGLKKYTLKEETPNNLKPHKERFIK
ncbi:hypothetical protein GWI33_002787 [Rhynchophorus ferrugineus]|uniref:Fatty acyl-CoA reductase n=1 Tax=Rhynchophorus ferrugineus TaxID=354439 RepID=A0A834IK15_RHYFE|nr:hypothetical protein GWI33_002787 [Rhynchophorus ferrugineus]